MLLDGVGQGVLPVVAPDEVGHGVALVPEQIGVFVGEVQEPDTRAAQLRSQHLHQLLLLMVMMLMLLGSHH